MQAFVEQHPFYGFFLCQLSASYGNSSAPPGRKLNHMIDAIGAIGSFHISNGQVVFSSQYYPARPYKIWEFYDRNMSKSNVPWAGWSDYNLTAMSRWEQIPTNPDSARFHPNLDFWKIGKRILAGTEAPYWIGYEIDMQNLNNFKLFKFTEENDIFASPRPTMIPISMAIHERSDPDGTVWGSFSAMNFEEQRFVQGIFTIDIHGVRRVVGLYDYGVWDPNACGKNDEYIGDKTLLPGYIHSITSTENYLIIPLTSLLINPCKFKEPPLSNGHDNIQKGGLWGMDFYDMVPLRFLIFNKKTRQFSSEEPLEVFPSMFVTHQLNAYDSPDGNIIADMVVYDSHDPYVKYFYTDFLTSQLYPSTARILRFTLDLKQRRVMYNYLIPQETIAADFPQFNHKLEQKPYQWAYIVEHPFAAGNRIIKINVDEPSGSRNQELRADISLVLHEPWFVPKPDSRKEDDGVLLIRALDVIENKALLLVIDAETMKEMGRAFVPISIPFGFHNRFYSKHDLGLPEGFSVNNVVNHFRPSETKYFSSHYDCRHLRPTNTDYHKNRDCKNRISQDYPQRDPSNSHDPSVVCADYAGQNNNNRWVAPLASSYGERFGISKTNRLASSVGSDNIAVGQPATVLRSQRSAHASQPATTSALQPNVPAS
ncbi:retinal pigment epithelial membrane protein [Teladorsagia circumcincta]|uniref:Retinal pigment epithelial membrane protein n=1 Tax=Teladorsagia circumcincta TaxID=45464 RepID=A0A2G9UTE9_TELCI|nr:retinal pigment epithelial membrane protein [Teladorsagia circumcincta]